MQESSHNYSEEYKQGPVPTHTIDYNNLINCLDNYMFTNENVDKILKQMDSVISPPNITSKPIHKPKEASIFVALPKSVQVPVETPDHIALKIAEPTTTTETLMDYHETQTPKLDLYYPKEKDALFWCYFIIKNGFFAYEYPGATSFANEKEERFKNIDLLRANKDALKTHKIKCIKEDVEDELINKEKIGMKTFIALCVSCGINVLFIHKRKCFDLVCNMDLGAKTHIVVCEDNLKCASKYGVQIDASEGQISYYRENYFKWESVDKPLKAMGHYKSEELAVLCKKIGLDFSSGQKTKKEMYELLIMNM